MVGVAFETTGLGLCGRGIRGGLLCKTLAEAHVGFLASSPTHATVLGLGVGPNPAGAREFHDTEVEEDQKVRCQIA